MNVYATEAVIEGRLMPNGSKTYLSGNPIEGYSINFNDALSGGLAPWMNELLGEYVIITIVDSVTNIQVRAHSKCVEVCNDGVISPNSRFCATFDVKNFVYIDHDRKIK